LLVVVLLVVWSGLFCLASEVHVHHTSAIG